MAGKRLTMNTIEQIRQLHSLGYGSKKIAGHLSLSRNTVKKYLRELSGSSSGATTVSQVASIALDRAGDGVRLSILKSYFPEIDELLPKRGYTLHLLWERYRTSHPDGYGYSQFCYHYSHHREVKDAVMHFEHKYGDKMFIDFAGEKVSYIERGTGEVIECEFFACLLGGSQYTYAQAIVNQRKENFIHCIENGLHYFGGVPAVLVPDNLKSGVTSASRYDPVLNDDFLGMANHYGCAVMPARSLKPRDKSLIENHIRTLYTRVYTQLDGQTFFSITELNKAIISCVDKHNHTLFQGRDHSRRQLFDQYEKQELSPLPQDRYELKDYVTVKVMKNSYVQYGKDKHYYSVPFRYIGSKVKICAGVNTIEIYYNRERIAVHPRDRKPYKYTTVIEHLPSHHQYVSEWNPDKFIHWASKIDLVVQEYITRILEQSIYPEILYRGCSGILQLSKRVGKERLVAACKRGIECGAYGYSFIIRVLKNNTENIEPDNDQFPGTEIEHNNIRGAGYYQSQLINQQQDESKNT